MKKDQEATGAKRREFLKLAGPRRRDRCRGGGGGEPAAADRGRRRPSRAGYHETAHVKKAYELARF